MPDMTKRLIRLIEPAEDSMRRKPSPLERNVRRMAESRPETLRETLDAMRCAAEQPEPISPTERDGDDKTRTWRLELQRSLLRNRVGTMTGAYDRSGNLMCERPGRRSPISARAMQETTSRLIGLERAAERNALTDAQWVIADFETEVLMREEWLIYLVADMAEQARDADQRGLANELEILLARMSRTLARDARKSTTPSKGQSPRIVVPTLQTKALVDAMDSALA